jgi:hypothetical protein
MYLSAWPVGDLAETCARDVGLSGTTKYHKNAISASQLLCEKVVSQML